VPQTLHEWVKRDEVDSVGGAKVALNVRSVVRKSTEDETAEPRDTQLARPVLLLAGMHPSMIALSVVAPRVISTLEVFCLADFSMAISAP